MNKSKETLLIINSNSIWDKMKMFFKKSFFKNEKITKKDRVKETEIPNTNDNQNSILKDIKIKENKELLYLQNQFKMGKIKEKDLSIEERIGLEKLYKQQIYDLKKSIENYKNKILIIKKLLIIRNVKYIFILRKII